MIQKSIEEIRAGMILGKSLYSANGDLLLAAGYKLKFEHLKKLKSLGYPVLWIQEAGTEQIVPEELISEQLSLQTNAALRESSEMVLKRTATKFQTKEDLNKALKDRSQFKNIIPAEKIIRNAEAIIDQLLENPDVLINMSTIRSANGFVFQHNLDVTVISVILAFRLKLSKADIIEMATGTLLHDIGLTVIPENIISKGTHLTYQEYSLYKEHTTFGYAILKENPRISPLSSHISFQHHERQDGGGFPRGLTGDNYLPSQKRLNNPKGSMHRYAEIVAVADAYDSMVSPFTHQEAKTPEQAMRALIKAAGSQLNKTVVDALITSTPVFPVGAFISIIKGPKEVIGFKGFVSKLNQDFLDAPEIVLFYTKNGRKIRPITLDLSDLIDIQIQFVLKN